MCAYSRAISQITAKCGRFATATEDAYNRAHFVDIVTHFSSRIDKRIIRVVNDAKPARLRVNDR
jgi:hypothetical protein